MPPRKTDQTTGTGNEKRTQYLAAFIATLGGFVVGTALGWTSPTKYMLVDETSSLQMRDEQFSWVGGMMPLGALLGCPFAAGSMDRWGRKNTMLIMTIPTTVGWALAIWAQSVVWFYASRLLIGFAAGSISTVVPLYTSEIAEKEIRGTLGTYFQLQVTTGILYVNILGPVTRSLYFLNVSCATIPIVYLGLLFLIPESPNFHLMKGKIQKARSSLTYFRGPRGTVEQELSELQHSLAKTERERVPLMEAFRTKPAKLGLFIGLGVMFFQQFSGCNAIIFFATDIFKAADDSGPVKTGGPTDGAYEQYAHASKCAIFLSAMSVVATYVSTLIVDRLGRRMLLSSSIIVMGVCTFLIGGFFWLKEGQVEVAHVAFVPLASLCVFIVMFSVGFGPIPWMLISEIFPAQIKGTACSIACMANWLFAFFVTKFFPTLKDSIGDGKTFWVFTAFAVLGTVFVFLVVPETKGKTMDEIQEMLGAGKYRTPTSKANDSSADSEKNY